VGGGIISEREEELEQRYTAVRGDNEELVAVKQQRSCTRLQARITSPEELSSDGVSSGLDGVSVAERCWRGL